MSIADRMGHRSLCSRRQIGAIIVTPENRPIATGYNGPPATYPVEDNTCSSWCPRAQNNDGTITYGNCVSIHAEANALLFADRRDYEDGTIYVTSFPCWDCAKMIANSGLLRIVTRLDPSRDSHREPQRTADFLAGCGIGLEIHDDV